MIHRLPPALLLVAVASTLPVDAGDPSAQASVHLKPMNLAALNTPADEDDPFVSRDGRRLLYTSNASKHYVLLESSFPNRGQYWPANERWPAGTELEGPNPDNDSRSPFLTTDNHDLYYAESSGVKAPPGEKVLPANYDLVHAIKLVKPTQFTAPTFLQSLCTPADELHPWLTDDGKELYFSRKTKEGWRVFVSTRAAASKGQGRGAFSEATEVAELPIGFHHASVSHDGRKMYLQGPLENHRSGIYRSTRMTLKQPWGRPEPLEGLDHPDAKVGDTSPCVSRDGSRLYFSSDRPGGKGGRDLWVVETRWFTK